nr:protein pal1 [Quercus suber]
MAARPAMLAASGVTDRQPSPSLDPNHLHLNLKSNNPFRNRTSPATSPSPQYNLFPQHRAPPSPQQPAQMSRNPFLDSSDMSASPVTTNANSRRFDNDAPNANAASFAADIFNGMSLNDQPPPYGPSGAIVQTGPPLRAGTMPMRSAHSGDRREPRSHDARGPSSPEKRVHVRPRGASESSVMDKDRRDRRERGARGEHRERTESEERRRRERRKEREERHRREKERSGKSGRSGKKPQGLDIIDKLDVTGIYGQGLFHHDGPFDACNPHRNARRNQKAPMQAFPEGSANMALGGSGPVRSRLDLDTFHGRGEEAFTGFSATRKANTSNVINPTDRTEQVHGDETYGLGTSTFLDGAPAPRSAMQRRGSEDANGVGGISRTKSIAQRWRGISNPRRSNAGEPRSPDSAYRSDSPPRYQTLSAGGASRARYNKDNEINPFDTDYSAAFDKKGTQIRIAEQEHPANIGRPRASSASKNGNGLVKTVTADSLRPVSKEGEAGPSNGGSGGFLNRMKSLKGGRRTRPERRES